MNNLCKICWEKKQELWNPFISPCYCRGSLKHIHLVCFFKSIKEKNKCTVCNYSFYNINKIISTFIYILFCEMFYFDLIKYDTIVYNYILFCICLKNKIKRKYAFIYLLRIIILNIPYIYNIKKLHFYLVFFHLYKIINDYYNYF